ncbi:glycosyl hydrolase 53 family protein [Paenibacillus luteus]|uniref:glycosyl hydrolase 53 family protein n=1 Tax=Paenibacillus luteus TaxID=2545753 RepID=UPI001144F8C8|nr:glycosyl hydrolase 53 family protein [Paenibacillus luteus]
MGRVRRFRSSISIFIVFCMVSGLFTGLASPSVHAAGTAISVPNGSFENDFEAWTTSFTAADGVSPITIQGSWIPSGGGTKRLDYWSASAYSADTQQTITGLVNGSYTLSAWVERGAGFNESYLYAKNTGLPEVKVNVPQSGQWVQIHLPVVVTNHQLTLGVYADGLASASNFMGVDNVTFMLDEAAPAKDLENTSFESGLAGWETSFGPEGSTSPIAIKSDWSPADGGTNRLNYWSDAPYTANTYQTATGLANGAYTLTAWISSGGGFNESYIYAKDTGRAEAKVAIPVSSSSWTKINLPVIVENNSVTVGFYADGPADAWLGIDLVSFVKDEEVELEPVGIAIGNFSFQANGKSQQLDEWTETGDVDASFADAPGYLSSYSLSHWSERDYKVTTSQTLTGLENGYYTLTGWVQNSGGQHASYLFARDNGTSEARAALPIGSTWTKVYLRGIQVMNGKITIGLHSDANAGNSVKLDVVELVKDDQAYRFLKGGDVSELSYVESQGGKFFDENGQEKDLFQILKENGHDIVRLRVYNEPGKGHGDGSYYRPAGIMDKADILKLAKRAKAAGLQIQLSFHYSDYWTNGATHNIPNAWQTEISGLANDAAKVDKLEQLLRAYTAEVMEAMVAQGTAPEFVSLGNEMQSGILFPYGRASSTSWGNLARFLQAGAEAVKTASPQSKVILHLDDAGNYSKYESFFDQIEARNVDYDIIGPSYYPFWTDLTIEQIVAFCNYFSEKYDKDIMIMETGYNWNPALPNGTIGQLNDNGPYPADTSSPQGQKEFMINLFNGLKSVNNGRVIGDLYWDPIMIAVPGVGWAIKESDDQPDLNVVSNTTLFDFGGKALPAHDAYRQNTEGSTLGHLSGVVQGTSGNRIANATIQTTVNGKTHTTTSDAAGNYFIPDLPISTAYELEASKNGYLAGQTTVHLVNAGEFTANQTITLTGGSVAGVVKDQEQHTIAGVKVSAIINGITYAAVTDPSGHYTLADLPASTSVTVMASKEGYAEGYASGIEVEIGAAKSGVELLITLNSGRITGTVIGTDQAPIAAAKVSVAAGGKVYEAVSGQAGNFTISNVPAGAGYMVTAEKIGYLSAKSVSFTVAVGHTTSEILVELVSNFGTIVGIVTDSSYAPVEGATVVAVKGEQTYTAQTDASGKYSLVNVLGGSGYVVTASKNGYLNGLATGVTVTALTPNAPVHLKLATVIPLTNAGFETQGASKFTIPGWTITGTENATFVQTHTNAKDGRYVFSHWLAGAYTSDAYQTLSGLANGYYKVTAWFYNGGDQKEYYMYAKDSSGELARFDIPKSSSMTAQSMDVLVKNGELTIGFYTDANAGNWALIDAVSVGYLGAGTGNISGVVQNESGAKLADAEVKITINGIEYITATNVEGEFILANLPVGVNYTVFASKAGFRVNSTSDISVADQQTTTSIRLTLSEERVEATPTPEVTPTPETTPTPGVTPTPEATPKPAATPVSTPSTTAPVLPVVKVDLKQADKNETEHSVSVSVVPAAGATGVIVEIPAQQIAELASSSIKEIIVKTGFATFSFSIELFKNIISTSSSSVQLSVEKLSAITLSSELRQALSGNTVYDFTLSVDGMKLTDFGNGMINVKLPYVRGQGQNAHSVVAYYITDDAKLEIVKNARYDAGSDTVSFSPKHFSKYAAAYKAVSFTDLAKAAWAQQSIEFLAARGIISGFTNQTFKPEASVTRAQFLQMLMGILDTPAAEQSSSFKDVKEGAWYAAAVAAAEKLGIVNGNSDGSFGVNDVITREEMAVILHRAIQVSKVTLDKNRSPETFEDQADFAAYAAEAIRDMQLAGLINGIGQARFAPKASATRAQAAVILERLFHTIHEID